MVCLESIQWYLKVEKLDAFNKNIFLKKIITWMLASVSSQTKASQHPCKSRADSLTEI